MSDATLDSSAPQDSASFAQARNRLHALGQEVSGEMWKRDHQRAMQCLAFEETLAFSVSVYDLIMSIDENAAERLLDLRPEEAELFHATIRSLLKLWEDQAKQLQADLRTFTSEGFALSRALEFRKRADEVAWILKDESEKFDHPAMIELRDAAIDELRARDAS